MHTLDAFRRSGTFFKGNLHTHSNRSDGAHSPEEVCRRYREAGYDFLALSDHFLPLYDFPVTDTTVHRSEGFTTLLSAEVHVRGTSLGETWHILAVGLPPTFEATHADETGPMLARRCREAGAFVGIVHPAWYSLSVEDAQSIDSAHAIEIYNHTSAVKSDRGDGCALLDQLLAKGLRLSGFASDDAHFHFNDAFGAWVMVKAENLDPERLIDSLKLGHYYSSQGPLLEDITIQGSSLEVRCSPVSSVMLLGKASRSECVFGEHMTSASLPLDRITNGGFGRVVAIDACGKRAWSNPIWLGADA